MAKRKSLKDAKVKYWPTKKLKEIIDENYNRGVNDTDYGPIIDEIKRVYNSRMAKQIPQYISKPTIIRVIDNSVSPARNYWFEKGKTKPTYQQMIKDGHSERKIMALIKLSMFCIFEDVKQLEIGTFTIINQG